MPTAKKAAGWPTEWDVDVAGELARPFPPSVVKWRAGNLNKDSGSVMALAYVDARDIDDRLNQVVGPEGWNFYVFPKTETQAGRPCVFGTLTILGSSRCDVGYANGDKDEEPLKGAVSDALKRCAVHFGIGHELYDMPTFWVELDGKKLSQTPIWTDKGGWHLAGKQPVRASRDAALPARVPVPTTPIDLSGLLKVRFKDLNLTTPQAKAAVALSVNKQSLKDLDDADILIILGKLQEDGFIDLVREVKAVS